MKGAFHVRPIPKSSLIAVFDEEKVTLLTPEGKIEREVRWPMDPASKMYGGSGLSVMEDGTIIGMSRNYDTWRARVIAMDSYGVERGHYDFNSGWLAAGYGMSSEIWRMTFRSTVGEATALPGGIVYVVQIGAGGNRELHFFDSNANHLYEVKGEYHFDYPMVIRNPSRGQEGLIGILISPSTGAGESAFVQFLGFE